MAKLWSLVPAAAAALAGCVPASSPEPATSSATSAYTCGYMCGDNGALIDGIPFFGMYLQNAPFQFLSNEPHLLRYARNWNDMQDAKYRQLDVDGGRLRMRLAGSWLYGPSNLENGVMLVGVGAAKYYVKIAHVHSGIVGGTDQGQRFWTTVTTRRAETYTLQWASPKEP